jgi:hypothetical protein
VEAAAWNPVTANITATDTNAAGTFMVTLAFLKLHFAFLELHFDEYLNYRLNPRILKLESQDARNRLHLREQQTAEQQKAEQ